MWDVNGLGGCCDGPIWRRGCFGVCSSMRGLLMIIVVGLGILGDFGGLGLSCFGLDRIRCMDIDCMGFGYPVHGVGALTTHLLQGAPCPKRKSKGRTRPSATPTDSIKAAHWSSECRGTKGRDEGRVGGKQYTGRRASDCCTPLRRSNERMERCTVSRSKDDGGVVVALHCRGDRCLRTARRKGWREATPQRP